MNWFFASGDAPFFFQEQLQKFTFFPDLWRESEGFGTSLLPALWINYPFRLITFLLSQLGLSWFVIDKLWWLLIFSLAVVTSYKLATSLGVPKRFVFISSLIYSTNTYFLLLFDGGQLGVALAYAFVPFVFLSLISKDTIRTALFVSILLFLDVRIGYVFFVGAGVIVSVLFFKKSLVIPKHIFLFPFIILGINLFWILPTVQYRESLNAIVEKTSSFGGDLSFFSVADFPHSFSLLHPNYPENLFGRVYFFKPEFLVLPILALSLFLWNDVSIVSLVFGIVGILGAFLSKGVQLPFPGVYEALFSHVPGFFLFRDPTKWYVLTALAYSMLIPQTIQHISDLIKKKYKVRHSHMLIFALFLLFWIFCLRLVFMGKVAGNVIPPQITKDYETLKNFIVERESYGRTLWLPSAEKFGYADEMHPALSASAILSESSPSGIIRLLHDPKILGKIANAGVSYIVVPEDVKKRMFLEDYIYKEELRDALIAALDSNSLLNKVPGFSRLAVYRVPNAQSFYSINNQSIAVSAHPYDRWTIFLSERKEESVLQILISYDPSWRLKIGEREMKPIRTDNTLMSFPVPAGNMTQGTLVYLPTQAAKVGTIISGIVLFSVMGFLLIKRT